ncbi:alpha/beta hydrolase [Sphingomonas sp. MG17]|uniref:Alpha/beta hydrolase n=1 Tax=Sphingomonas tagetis TaxID=2949092 RepID=A0A9X2HII3_9SPHN|nr:alpha/beta hydrolase [Sphingomonas tagetis]MCP3730267.1 alpha/beta hydrolase [Sphingomonas tagetis]
MTIARRIAELGHALGPDVLTATRGLFDAVQAAIAHDLTPHGRDLAYGPDPRHRLDIYRPAGAKPAPILVFVHGGGFMKGDKGDAGSWANANVGRMAARAGLVGVVINYRLAPDHQWPAGAEDVGAAVAWLKLHAAEYGGDADRIVLAGTSAGAVHVAGFLASGGESELRAAILMSGLYGYTPLEPRDVPYYGDAARYPSRMPMAAVTATKLPLLVACAEFDPPRFQAEFLGVIQARLTAHGAMPRTIVQPGHNHYSMTLHLGTQDRRLADEICAFVEEHAA